MSLSYINGDGGHLPPEVTAPTSSQLLADYNALSSPDKAAFRLAIAPMHFAGLEDEAAITSEDTNEALPGDTAGVQDAGDIWRLQGEQSDPGAWSDLIGGQALEGAGGAPGIGGDGGHLPGEGGGSSRLLAAWEVLTHAQRAAFRLAIKPAYSSAANQAARLALSNQVPGDYCRQSDLGLLRLRQLPATVDGNWDVLKLS